MPIAIILPSGKTIQAATGSRLLDALLDAGEAIVSTRGGEAGCGQCHVFVQDGKKSLSKTPRAENQKRDSIAGVGSKARLACQMLPGAENVKEEVL